MHPEWDEIYIFPEVYRLCAIELKEGRDVILDATNITPKVRCKNIDSIRKIYSDFDVYAYFINTDKEICKKRVEKRNSLEGELYLPIEVIDSYFNNLVIPSIEEDDNYYYVHQYGSLKSSIEKSDLTNFKIIGNAKTELYGDNDTKKKYTRL